jgi:hypothetical protein
MFERPALLVLGSTLALACTGDPPAEPAPAKTDASKTVAKVEPPAKGTPSGDAKASDARAGDAKAEPPDDAKAAPPDAKATPTATGPTLRAAAKRTSYMEIVASGGRPWLSLEGEAVPLVDGKFTRLPGTKGLMRCYAGWQCNIAELVGDPSGPHGLWLVLEEAVDRVGETYAVYHHDGKAWSEKSRREGVLVGYYAPLVEHRGAVFGLQRWQPDVDKELQAGEGEPSEREAAKYAARRDKELRKAKQGFVRLSGPEVEPPKVPPNLALKEAVTTADGTLWALAHSTSDPQAQRLLVWGPEAVEAKTVELPDPKAARLWASSGTVLVSGCAATVASSANDLQDEDQYCSEAYLAIREGETWQRVPIELSSGAPTSLEPVGVARAPDGALWVAFGHLWYETARLDASPIWHRPAGGTWAPAVVPTPEAVFGSPPTNGGWIARGLVWGADAVWAVLVDDGSRSVVLTSQPGTDPPTELPDDSKTDAERTPAPEPLEEEEP